ncbi:putative phosphorus acquisition-controlling protein [Golovinomyces cichoracearum]|uniref:Putative phosphorus acquisition-controlling protein n=1 Tax=Golovinomyces cichoracearum TaxID=62708 RepID=A0A420IK61_9PEZI|nr:putative phosphorus acquisition-controlling protein [Golovinomyces cichoracearum]
MSYSTRMNPPDIWPEQEITTLLSSRNGQQFPNMNSNEELCHNFQEFIQRRCEGFRINLQDEKRVTNRCAKTEMNESDDFTKAFLHGFSTVSSPSDFNGILSGGGCESLSNGSSCDSENCLYHSHQTAQDQQQNPSLKSSTVSPTNIDIYDLNSFSCSHLDNQQQQSPYDKFQTSRNELNSDFTPIFSPITPLEHHFNTFGYCVSEACFSPLSSPALQVQSDSPQLLDQQSSLIINSPISNGNDLTKNESSGMRFKTLDCKLSKSLRGNSFRVKKSPVVNSFREMKGVNTFSQSLDEIDLSYSPLMNTESSSHVSMAAGNSSLLTNISSSMGPPPLPPPAIISRSSDLCDKSPPSPESNLYKNYPATPASLMRLTQSSNDSIELKQAETNKLSSFESVDSDNTIGLLQEQFFKAGGTSGANISELGLVTVEKQEIPKVDNSTAEYPRVVESQQGFCRTKNRTSAMGIASSAPLARFSPNCKPLLPNGAKGPKDSPSLLLASKSNYQKILDGTPFPGVSYSPELSANITSKRTSHKIAEQGRRNRMNSALQEIASLLPRDQSIYGGYEKSGGSERTISESLRGSSQSANSKARTVEQAIKYINYLKNQLELVNSKIDQKQKQES